jgi:transmembrane sensor
VAVIPGPDTPREPRDPVLEETAAGWLVRQDRGLTPAEQDEFLQWLAARPEHREALDRHRQLWQRFNALDRWRPAHSATPNPDLLARRPSRRPLWLLPSAALAAAAAVALIVLLGDAPAPASTGPLALEATAYRREILPDGSVLELNRGAHAVVQFSPDERRVLLAHGEAQFAVTKDPRRPFVVRAAGVDVRAVGTAFHVRLAGEQVEVLVTEGRVRLSPPRPAPGNAGAEPPAPLVELGAGQRTVLAPGPSLTRPPVLPASPAEVARLQDWAPRMLEFDGTPLVEVVHAFNQRNAVQLVVADDPLRALPIVATIRSDNLEGFVRLLEATLGVRAERSEPGVITLRTTR